MRSILLDAFRVVACFFAGFGLVVAFVWVTMPEVFSHDVEYGPVDTVSLFLGDAAQVRALIEKHGCWTDTAPPGVIAGSVVFTDESGEHVWSNDRTTVEHALEQVLRGKEYGMEVHAFCR